MDKVKKIVSEDEYISLKGTFNSKIEQQQDEYSKLKNEIDCLKILHIEKPDAITLAKKYTDFKELTTEVVTHFIDYIEVSEKDVYGNQDFHIHWNI